LDPPRFLSADYSSAGSIEPASVVPEPGSIGRSGPGMGFAAATIEGGNLDSVSVLRRERRVA
jgi:hypothetical protein